MAHLRLISSTSSALAFPSALPPPPVSPSNSTLCLEVAQNLQVLTLISPSDLPAVNEFIKVLIDLVPLAQRAHLG